MESLRAECSGRLAGLQFLVRYIEYHNITTRNDLIVHYSGNKMLIGRIKWSTKRIPNNPTEFLTPEFDVQMAIEATLVELVIPYKCNHIQGHQYRKKPSKKQTAQDNIQRQCNGKSNKTPLRWEATLNIIADNLATAAYNDLKQGNMRDTFDPIAYAKVYFYLRGLPIMKNYADVIVDAWASQDFWEHMEKVYLWKRDTAELIEWIIIGTMHKQKPDNKKRFITRYVNNILPVLGLPSTVTPTTICPCCKAKKETPCHFLYCNANEEKWKDLYTHLVPQFNKYNVDPMLRVLLYMVFSAKLLSTTQNKKANIQCSKYE
eukprot:8327909-Ditylum_brightwellii.AAC.1